jgi:predicted PurR-regulated permease PerM
MQSREKGPTELSISFGAVFKVAAIVALCYLIFLLKGVLLSVLTAVVIASAIEPITRWFERRHVPRTLAVLTIYVVTALVVIGVFYLFLPILAGDVLGTVTQLPKYATQLLREIQPLDVYLAPLISTAPSLQDGLFFTASNVFGGAFNLVFIAVVSFYLAAQRYGVTNFLRIVTPLRNEPYVIDLWTRSQRKIGRWMQGQLLLALIIGLLTYIGLSFLGFEQALLLAVIAGVCELIPIFGPIIAALPAVLFAFAGGGVSSAMIVLGMYVLIQQVESQLIHPLVVNKMTGIPPIVSIIALVIGGTLAGILGIIIAVPVAAAFMEYIGDVEKQKYA